MPNETEADVNSRPYAIRVRDWKKHVLRIKEIINTLNYRYVFSPDDVDPLGVEFMIRNTSGEHVLVSVCGTDDMMWVAQNDCAYGFDLPQYADIAYERVDIALAWLVNTKSS